MNKKASVAIYITIFIALTIIVLIAAVIAPFGTLFTSAAFAAGDDILEKSRERLDDIENTTVRDRIYSVIDEARDAGEFNIDVTTDFYQYAWIFAVVMTVLIGFLFTRSLTEITRGSGGFI